MNDRWLVTAFRPGARNALREHSQKLGQAAGDQDLFDLHTVMFGELEAQGGGIVVGIGAASRQHGLHGLTARGEGPNGFSFESSLMMHSSVRFDVGASVPLVRPPARPYEA